MADERARFRNPVYIPPGGKWFYTVPETGVYIESAASRYELVYRVKQHLRANGKEIPSDLWERIQEHMCGQLPAGYCTGDADSSNKALSFFKILEYTERMLRGAPLTTRDEATRRAVICKTCPRNNLARCTSCNGMRKTALGLVHRAKLPLDAYLGVCENTGCVLAGQVYLDREWLASRGCCQETEADGGLPDLCWMKTETK